jgi:hypothetical protein
MKTLLFAAAAMMSIGIGVAYADGGDDEGGTLANTFFTELPGVVSTAPGAPSNNAQVNAYQENYQATTHAANTWMAPDGAARPMGNASTN